MFWLGMQAEIKKFKACAVAVRKQARTPFGLMEAYRVLRDLHARHLAAGAAEGPRGEGEEGDGGPDGAVPVAVQPGRRAASGRGLARRGHTQAGRV